MARLTEIQDDSEGVAPVDQTSRPNEPRSNTEAEILTLAQREQILFESGALEKLGLPKDFITLEQAQAQLEAQHTAGKKSSTALREQDRARRLAKHQEAVSDQDNDPEEVELDSDEDQYENTSEPDYNQQDDSAERLLREQEANEMNPRLESSLDLLIWTMPFGFLYTLLDVLVRQQYGETVGFLDEAKRLGGSLPVLALFIHYNLTSQRKVLLQIALFTISILCGCSLIHIVNKSTYEVVVQRVAPLGTLWIFAVVRLDLLPACVGLAVVAAFVQKTNMKIIFD